MSWLLRALGMLLACVAFPFAFIARRVRIARIPRVVEETSEAYEIPSPSPKSPHEEVPRFLDDSGHEFGPYRIAYQGQTYISEHGHLWFNESTMRAVGALSPVQKRLEEFVAGANVVRAIQRRQRRVQGSGAR